MTVITPDLIMSTSPCGGWPRERVERALEQLDCSSWTALVESLDLLISLARRLDAAVGGAP